MFVTAGLELGIEFSEQPQDAVVGRNKSAFLPCSSTSPNVTFTWTVDHKPLHLVNNDNRITILTNGSLHFKKVRPVIDCYCRITEKMVHNYSHIEGVGNFSHPIFP